MRAQLINATFPHEVLLDEFSKRQSKNKSYSQRAFARDLGISASRLTEILSGKAGLSAQFANGLAEKMGFSPIEVEIFTLMAVSQYSRSPYQKKLSQQKLDQLKHQGQVKQLTIEDFKVLNSWQAFTLIELTEVINIKRNLQKVSSFLNYTVSETEELIEKLLETNHLQEKKGRIVRTDNATHYKGENAAEVIREFHRHILMKALDSVENQNVKERTLSSNILAINKEDFKKIEADIAEFQEKINTKYSNAKISKTDVYTLSIQLFNLTKEKT